MLGQFAQVAEGILVAIEPGNLLFIAIGTFLGLFVGAIPGLSSPMAITVLIPLTYALGPFRAMYILLGIYVGTKLGGSYAAIMVRTPGTPAGACTALDGHPMAQRGEGDLALGYATLASTFGGLVGWILLFAAAPLISLIAVRFTSADIAVVAFVGLIFVATLSRASMVKGLMSVALGLLLSTVGVDPITGFARYTLGVPQLLGGFDFVAAMIGMFAISVVFSDLAEVFRPPMNAQKTRLRFPSLKRFFQGWRALAAGTGWGAIMGPLPGIGSVGATWISYSYLKNRSKDPQKFGTGIPEGIMAPESANNMCTGGALIPMLTLGIPGDPSTAVMLGALLLHGFRPGPLFFGESPELAFGIIGGMLVTNVMMAILAVATIGFFVRVLGTRRSFVFPVVLIMAVIGSFATTNSMFSVWVAVGFGLLGFFLYRYGFSLPAVVLALILGPIIEERMRLALVIFRGSPLAFVSSVPAIVGLIAGIAVIVLEIYRAYRVPGKKIV